MTAQANRPYHLGSAKLSKSNLSRMNEDKLHAFYEALALFVRLLVRCQSKAPAHSFRFKTHSIRWMHQRLIDVYLFSPGLSFDPHRVL